MMPVLAGISTHMFLFGAIALGARHAFDADHLSVIDGIARQNLTRNRMVAMLGGVLFSAGHVAVVAGIAVLGLYFFPNLQAPPPWLEAIGLAGSGSILIVLGMLNLRTAFAQDGSAPALAGLRSRLFSMRYDWLSSILVGGIFAISFDTIGIALGLSLAGKAIAGYEMVLAGLIGFGAGMIVVGGLNGMMVVRLVYAGNARSVPLLGLFSGTIGAANIILGCIALLKLAEVDISRLFNLDGLTLTYIIVAPVLASAALVALSSMRLRTSE